jgi:hypothetical protein
MDSRDRELIEAIRSGDREYDWNEVAIESEKNEGATERSRFQYYDGKFPDWPVKLLEAEYDGIMTIVDAIRSDDRDVETIIEENIEPINPVYTKGLTQLTLGSPQTIYNGGLLRAQVRYYDRDSRRPGLPPDTSALVYKLEADRTGVHLVNLSPSETRNVIVQAGAFCEHSFTDLKYQHVKEDKLQTIIGNTGKQSVKRTMTEKKVQVNGKYVAVELPPLRSIKLDLGMKRFVNQPSYAFPWHGGTVQSAFQ